MPLESNRSVFILPEPRTTVGKRSSIPRVDECLMSISLTFFFHPRSNEKTTYGLIFLIRKIQGVVFGEREFTEHGDSLGVPGRTT